MIGKNHDLFLKHTHRLQDEQVKLNFLKLSVCIHNETYPSLPYTVINEE